MKMVKTDVPFRFSSDADGVIVWEFDDASFDRVLTIFNAAARTDCGKSVTAWFDDERKIRTTMRDGDRVYSKVITGITGRSLTVLEHLVSRGVTTRLELCALLWKGEDRFDSAANRKNLSKILNRLGQRLLPYRLAVMTVHGEVFLKKF